MPAPDFGPPPARSGSQGACARRWHGWLLAAGLAFAVLLLLPTLRTAALLAPPLLPTLAQPQPQNAPPAALVLNSALTVAVDTPLTLTARVLPMDTALPITYTWRAANQPARTLVGGLSSTLALTWPQAGPQIVTVTAATLTNTIIATRAITVLPAPVVPPQAVSLTGVLTGLTNTPYTFQANVQPLSTTIPLTYAWNVTQQPDTVLRGLLGDAQQFRWAEPGAQFVQVSASNRAGSASESHFVLVVHPPPRTDLQTLAVTQDTRLTLDAERVAVAVPANAIKGTVLAALTAISTPTTRLPPGTQPLRSFTFDARTPDGTLVRQFDQPLTLVLSYTTDELRANDLAESDLDVLAWNGTRWQPISADISLQEQVVTVRLNELPNAADRTEFVLVGGVLRYVWLAPIRRN